MFGLIKAEPGRFAENGDHNWLGVLFAAGLLYVTYEGFGVVTNSAGDMRDPAKELPRAMFLALGIVMVVYMVVSSVVVMTLSLAAMDANQGHVLSEAGRHTWGGSASSSSASRRCWRPPPGSTPPCTATPTWPSWSPNPASCQGISPAACGTAAPSVCSSRPR